MKKISLMRPGVALMQRMQLPAKLLMLSMMLVVPLIVVCSQLLMRIQDDVTFVRAETNGVQLLAPAYQLMSELQTHRGQTNLLLSGNNAVAPALDATGERLNKATQVLNDAVQAQGGLALGPTWNDFQQRLARLPATRKATADQSFSEHTLLVADLRRFIYLVGNNANLIFDPDALTYLLIDMAVSRIGAWTEQLGQLRGVGARFIQQVEPDGVTAGRLQALSDELDRNVQDLKFSFSLIAAGGGAKLSDEATLSESVAYLATARQLLAHQSGGDPVDPRGYFAAGTKAIEAVVGLNAAVIKIVDDRLQERLRSLLMQRLGVFTLTVVGFSLLGYVLLAFYIGFVRSLRSMIDTMQGVAAGDLRTQVRMPGRDEIALFSQMLNSMTQTLSTMVADVRSNAALVAHAGGSMAQGSKRLADRTEQQAANLEQTSASVQELSGNVTQYVQNVQHANERATQVRDAADAGAQAMHRAVASVESVQQSTSKMDEIIGVIDGLAFQTNILALNAAVEAARAGEQGRGFAVVASEVRSLAQRSAASAKEIRNLIQTSSQQVGQSVALIQGAGKHIGLVAKGIHDVASGMNEISSLSLRQSQSLAEVTAAIQQLDQITQDNAQLVEATVADVLQVEARSGTLSQTVSNFKLNQGTADEAMNLVYAAMDGPDSETREEFLRRVNNPENHFWDRDMYLFVLTAEGVYRAFGGDPVKVGTTVSNTGLVNKIVAQANLGPGWVEYSIVNPTTGIEQSKMSYVAQLHGLYLGCGVYKSLLA